MVISPDTPFQCCLLAVQLSTGNLIVTLMFLSKEIFQLWLDKAYNWNPAERGENFMSKNVCNLCANINKSFAQRENPKSRIKKHIFQKFN